MSNTQIVQSNGIYHGLPVYPSSLKGLTAIITGANGISGYYMLRVLAQDPERWTKIYCLSRRPPVLPDGLPKNAEHIALDFLKQPEEIASVLKEKGVKADYIFFYSYLQTTPKAQSGPKPAAGLSSDAEEMCRVNVALLRNFCEALPLASIKPKRILLQTGAKNYGVHLGPTATPSEEDQPRVTLEPNFYYAQEDYLWSFCASHSISWNVCMPSGILGAVPDAAMNMVLPLGIYASVQKHLNKPLEFPCDLASWDTSLCLSTSTLNAHMEQWAVLTPPAANHRFNTVDSSPFTWGNFWPKYAAWYRSPYKPPVLDDAAYTSISSRFDTQPRGFGPPAQYRFRFRLADWARDPAVQRAWEELVAAHSLSAATLQDMDIDRIFGFMDGCLLGGSVNLTMNKARKLGWHGFVDSCDAFKEVLEEFALIKMLPPVGRE
ncbi:hypothetical protein ACN47E_003801 [Coniothyrium glycines]